MAGSPEQENSYSQPALTGFEAERIEETVLEHVVVETVPIFKQHKAGNEWQCQVYAQPDIFHQERNERYQLHTKTYANEAKKQRLRPGDIVTLHGIPSTQEIETAGGEKRMVNHFTVTRIEVLSRSRRVSLTVYEKQRGR